MRGLMAMMLALLASGCGSSDAGKDAAVDAADVPAHEVCPTGLSPCGGWCVNLRTDEAHCGECDKACGDGYLCSVGACACPGGATSCDGICTNTDTDPESCGGCGNACAEGETCVSGNCL